MTTEQLMWRGRWKSVRPYATEEIRLADKQRQFLLVMGWRMRADYYLDLMWALADAWWQEQPK
jgi:hypothetical protein